MLNIFLPVAVGQLMVAMQPIQVQTSGHDMVSQINGILSELERIHMPSPRVVRTPSNPCAEDQRRFRCTSASCLRRSAEELSPSCAAFLLGSPEPSPAPQEQTARSVFSVISSDSQGHVQRMSGTVPQAMLAAMMPPGPDFRDIGMPAEFAAMIPPEIRALMGSSMRGAVGLANPQAAQEKETEEEKEPRHPCAREIASICMPSSGVAHRSTIETCLVAHLSQLSASCKCFVHQTIPSAQAHAAVGTGGAGAPPQLAVVVALPHHMPRTAGLVDGHPVELHPLHRLSCLFFFTALFLLTLMVTRAVLLALCTTRQRNVVMVPPQATAIRVRSSNHAAAPVREVQVAKPFEGKA